MNKEEILKELEIIQTKFVESQAKANSDIIVSSVEKRDMLEEKIAKVKVEEQQNQVEIAKTEAAIALNKEKVEEAISKIAALGEEMQAIEEGPDFNKKTAILRAKITNLRKKKDAALEEIKEDTALLEVYDLRSKIASETLTNSVIELDEINKSFEEKTPIERIIEDVKNDKLTDEELLDEMVTIRESLSDDFYKNDMLTADKELEENKELQARCESEIQQYEAKLADDANYPVYARANSRNKEIIPNENKKISDYRIKLEEYKLETLNYENKNSEIDKELSNYYQAVKKLNDEKNALWFKLSHTNNTSDNYQLLIDSIRNNESELRTIQTSISTLEDEKDFNNNIIKIVAEKEEFFNNLSNDLSANLDKRNTNVVLAAKQADQIKLQQAKSSLEALKNRASFINSYLEESMYNFEDKLQASIDEKNKAKVANEPVTEETPVVEPVQTEEPQLAIPAISQATPIITDTPPRPFINKENPVNDPFYSSPVANEPVVSEPDKKKKGPAKLVAVKEASVGVLNKIKSWVHKNKWAKWAALVLALISAIGIYAGYEMFGSLQGKEPIPSATLFEAGVSEETIKDYTDAIGTTDIPTVTVTPTGTTISVTNPTNETTAPIVTPMPTETAAPIVTPVPTETTAPIVTPVPTETTAPIVTPVPTETTAPIVTPMPTETTAPIVTPMPTETAPSSLQNIEVLANERWDLGDGETYVINTPNQEVVKVDPNNIIVGQPVRGENGNVYFTIDTSLIKTAVR